MDLSTSVDYYNAQVAVLGALLINPDEVAGGVCQAVLPQDFSNSTLRNVYRAARQLYLEGKGIDPVVVVEAAGTAYERTVADVMRMTPTWVNWEDYMRLLLDGSKLQRIRGLAEKLIEAASMENARGLLAQAEGLLLDRSDRKAASYIEMVNDYLDRQSDGTPPRFLKWGEEHIDDKLNISPGRFIIIGADSSTGKTALALQFAYFMARNGHRVGFLSYETSTEDAADRIFANVAGVDLPRSKKKKLNSDDFKAVMAEGERAQDICFEIIETNGYDIADLKSEILRGLFDVVFIDYVQLISSDIVEPSQAVRRISMELHTMSQRLGVTIIALSQVTPPETDKNGHRRYLKKTDLRESKQLHIDAEAVMMLDYFDPANRDGDRILIIDKNKDGACGQMRLSFDPLHMRFSYLPPPRSETFKKIDKAVNETKKKNKGEAIEGQTVFYELPGNECPEVFQEVTNG